MDSNSINKKTDLINLKNNLEFNIENSKTEFPSHKQLQNFINIAKDNEINKNIQDANNTKIKRLKSSEVLQNKKYKLKLNRKSINNLGGINSYKVKTINNNFDTLKRIERRTSHNNLKKMAKALEKENEKTFDYYKNNLNNISIYSTQYFNEEIRPNRYNKVYYSLDNKKNEKRRMELLKTSYNFNKYNNDRAIMKMINKFQNKVQTNHEINNFGKKYNQVSYLKKLPTKVAFGRGTSTKKIPEIKNNFNKILKQKIKKKSTNRKINELFSSGFNIKTESYIINNNNRNISENKKSFFITNSNISTIPRDTFGNELYPVLGKHKILKNILPKEVDYNTKTTLQDIINSEIHPLLRYQKKIMSQSSNLISQELNVLFAEYMSLSNMDSDKKNLYKRNDILIELSKDQKFIKLMKGLIGKDEEIDQKLKDKINEEEKKKKEIRRRYLLKKFKEVIENASEKIKRYKIDIQIFFSLMEIDRTTDEYKKNFRDKGQYLFRVIKANDINEIISVINQNIDLVSYKDDFDQIPLHICAKRNLYEIVAFLLSRLSPIDAQDESGRTALMIAAKNNYLEFVTILLFENANPIIKDKFNQKASDMTTNERIHLILKRAEALYNLHLFLEGKNLKKYINNGLDFLYKKELEINYEKWINKGLKILKDAS